MYNGDNTIFSADVVYNLGKNIYSCLKKDVDVQKSVRFQVLHYINFQKNVECTLNYFE